MRARVKSYIADRQAEKAGEAGEAAAAATTSARKITVPIMDEGWRERAIEFYLLKFPHYCRGSNMLVDRSWADFGLGVPLSCRAPKPLLPNTNQPKHCNKSKSTQLKWYIYSVECM